ncbi:CBS domain-containing protein [Pyxidicoccus caerfyrddinensis]|jgi:acetoin utilization protein AcuB|uniref:CBS domain-containing protein n=1 Tax=Pyxidicoccus caerfyrddinensis TaxID=2709663 RepID=UPI001F079B5F|nr:CBS domain-containing protein [Pyxidicoccus caerfyrddinensis]
MDTIDSFMTRSVHTIGVKSPLVEAHRVMNEYGIRHLPVLEGGRLVGLVSQRDLHLIETLKDVDPKEVRVEEAMSQDCYTVETGTPLAEVARELGRHKYGSAVITRGTRMVGIFTTTDAMRALQTVLSRAAAPAPAHKPASRKAASKEAARKAKPAGTPAARKAAVKKAASRRTR